MAFESVNYQCPACGGPLHFASAEQKLVCDYCDSRFEVEEVEALYRERQDKADAKADAAAATPKPVADEPTDAEAPATAPDAHQLQQRVTELEAENERLRQQVKALQDLLAEQG